MDWSKFVELVDTTRLIVLAIALGLTIVLGVAGALKAKAFQWSKLASFLAPGANFFWYILGYVATAGVAALVLPEWKPAVITTYSFIIVAMVVKIKEQLAALAPGLTIVNWKLPLETKPPGV
jgi:hypothetical protein